MKTFYPITYCQELHLFSKTSPAICMTNLFIFGSASYSKLIKPIFLSYHEPPTLMFEESDHQIATDNQPCCSITSL